MSLTPGRSSRRLRVEGLVNARDLGALRCREGKFTPSGVFYAALSAMAAAPPGGVLFHCVHGHDRTVVIAQRCLRHGQFSRRIGSSR